jgi:hypothetical protein
LKRPPYKRVESRTVVQAPTSKKSTLMVIAGEFGIDIKDMKVEKDKLTARDRQELASAIARQNGIPAEECDWEVINY